MKYLKKFESNDYFDTAFIDIKNLCDAKVSYIIDDMPDFRFSIEKLRVSKLYGSNNNAEIYQLAFFRYSNSGEFSWMSVKENLIPLFDILNRKYDLKESSIIIMTNKSTIIKKNNKPGKYAGFGLIDHVLNIEDILEDNIRDNSEIIHIQITIKTN